MPRVLRGARSRSVTFVVPPEVRGRCGRGALWEWPMRSPAVGASSWDGSVAGSWRWSVGHCNVIGVWGLATWPPGAPGARTGQTLATGAESPGTSRGGVRLPLAALFAARRVSRPITVWGARLATRPEAEEEEGRRPRWKQRPPRRSTRSSHQLGMEAREGWRWRWIVLSRHSLLGVGSRAAGGRPTILRPRRRLDNEGGARPRSRVRLTPVPRRFRSGCQERGVQRWCRGRDHHHRRPACRVSLHQGRDRDRRARRRRRLQSPPPAGVPYAV